MSDSDVKHSEWPSATASSLLARALADDPMAWQTLLEKYGPRVYRWARSRGLQSHDAQDIQQAVFLVVALKLEKLRRDRDGDSFRAWLSRVTQNKINDWFRSRTILGVPTGGTDHHHYVNEFSDENPEKDVLPISDDAIVLLEDCGEAVQSVRSGCQERTWQMFWQVVVEDRRPVDVAADLGVSVNVVYVAKSRVARRLKNACERLR